MERQKRLHLYWRILLKKNDHHVEIFNIGIKPYRDNPENILKELENVDIVGFGSPAYHMNMLEPMLNLFEQMMANRNNYQFSFRAFFFLNYGGITSGKAFEINSQKLKVIGISLIGAMKIAAPHFHHNEIFPMQDTYQFIEEFYNKMQEKGFVPMDWVKEKHILRPEKMRVNIIYPLAQLIGKKRNLSITINKDKCVGCGKCAAECPVSAITINNNNVFIDTIKCIHCYHCIVTCKRKSIVSPTEKIDGMIRINKKIIGKEYPANKIYI